ncbi:DMT family transporter [Streptomyces sp. NBC_01335]|uniref:DMT family transporter n=1 Tax=Streptomyces sp. NBC_01335 TaxID=2903828 RepID=UPI002E11CD0C|nr:DMT family transporter [Streptomyces sp. NBC_01335]
MNRRVIQSLLVLTALFWGATFNLVGYTVDHLSPALAAALRYSLASVFTLVVLGFRAREALDTLKRAWKPLLAMAGIGVVVFNLFLFLGLRHTTPTNGALIQATNPLLTALIARAFLHERIGRGHRIGTSISFAGVAVLILSGSVQRLQAPDVGDLLCLGATFCLAAYSVIGGRFLKGGKPVLTTGLTTLMGCAGLWLTVPAVGPLPDAHTFTSQPAGVWWSLAFVGVLSTVLAYIFWNYGVSHLGVPDTAVFFHLVPVFTVLASLAMGQSVTPVQIVAGAVVLMGVFISSRHPAPAGAPAAAPEPTANRGACTAAPEQA